MNFEQAFENVVGHEGGFQDDPRDDGNWTGGKQGLGELKGTKFGISAASYPTLDIRNLTVADARAIYLRDFWKPLRADELPAMLREFVFDFAVNSGVGAAAMALQTAAGALRDGSVGPRTIEAVRRHPPRAVLRLVFVERAMVFALSPKDRVYGRGWYARLFDKTVAALAEGPAQ